MSFFRLDSHKYSSWLFVAIGFSLVAFMSTSNITHAKSHSENKQSMPESTMIDKVFIDKSARTLQLLSGNNLIKSYPIALGGSPVGHKRQQGDKRTPIGNYTLDYKNENSKFYRSIHVSYPNATDKARAKSQGVSPGGDIMIHGQKNGFGHLAWVNQKRDWTDGCIAVTNDEMDEIMAAVKIGTPIEIVD